MFKRIRSALRPTGAAPTVTQAHLQSPLLLGGRVAELVRARADVTDAMLDEADASVAVRYHDGARAVYYMDNLLPALRTMSPRQQTEYLRNYLSPPMLDPGTSAEAPIYPVLKPESYVEETYRTLQAAGVPANLLSKPYHFPVAPGLVGTLVRDAPGQMAVLSERDVDETLDGPDLITINAYTEFLSYLQDHPIGAGEITRGLYQVTVDGNYDASVAFVPELWVDQIVTGRPAVLFAARNLVFVTDADDPTRLAELREALTIAEQPAYPIAPDALYMLDADGQWAILPE
ncbi:MAG: hypothetical protein ACK5PP_11390 [Acidimicrobiales bacterium]